VTRPRAADDFAAIRARMEELRRERAGVPADDEARRTDGPRPYAAGNRPSLANRVVFPPVIVRRLSSLTSGIICGSRSTSSATVL
jgi:hypothetical protein